MVGLKILIRGIVQGVGFRPFVYTLAVRYGLTGWVCNSSRGVEIVVNGPEEALNSFVSALRTETPPLARIDSLTSHAVQANGYANFSIQKSEPLPGEFLPVSPDVSICPDCQRELFDPSNRRFRYPFINCTNCGPRFTIIKNIPYDRPNTTMSGFPMCPECQSEYENPLNRRFHAQPVACLTCGPQIWFEQKGERQGYGENGLQQAREFLKAGKILAIKGLGGFHLACDATNPAAVEVLRQRKKRSDKPFALMAFDMDAIRRHCIVSEEEAELLQTRQRPIVLFERKVGSPIAEDVAPKQNTLGVMLPYTPLHLLLLEPASNFPDIFVMTSGNLSEEPIAFQDEEARERLASLADAFLMHDRPIHMRVDDSVQRITVKKPYFIRRSRGFAPDSIQLPVVQSQVIAAGAELKNTFCLTRKDYAFVSHHIGDLENIETLNSFEQGIAHYERLFKLQPEAVGCDLHPNYLSTRYAQARSEQEGLPLVYVQHHHAHLAACLAENGYPLGTQAIGLTFDGTGYGLDGTIWGGEVLVGGYANFERVYHLTYTPQPGGDAATHRPSRMALAHLWSAGIPWAENLPPVMSLSMEEKQVLKNQLERSINTPLTSSMGRLFDAISSLIGIRQTATYEGQAAMELEALADGEEKGYYHFSVEQQTLDPTPLLAQLLADYHAGVSISSISARFHNSLVELIVQLCDQIHTSYGIDLVALSGGVWQNLFLLERIVPRLQAAGLTPIMHHKLPPNDGCISLGQAIVTAQLAFNPEQNREERNG